MTRTILLAAMLAASALSFSQAQPQIKHSKIGDEVKASNGALTITCIGKKQSFSSADKNTYDSAINSPKSVNFHPDGTRFYVNSLEGCKTVVYDAKTAQRLKVIEHHFGSGEGPLWAPTTEFYKFTHYDNGRTRAFDGKPVESAFSHGGRYLWVPYYRRTFDINAQDPSAVAVIDTRTDSIVRMFDCGPLPKMISCSHDNRTIAVTHWGNNTVGLIDISSPDINNWHHRAVAVVERELPLNFSLTTSVDRDNNSGLLLRGTVFTPDDRFLLVGMMGGGAIGVVDVKNGSYLGRLNGSGNVRHLITVGQWLYGSNNSAGIVRRAKMADVVAAIENRSGNSIKNVDWQTCQVGAGTRTIEASPSGRFIFAACNSASQLNVVDTETMKVIAAIDVDSYPVGLDVSLDGTLVVVTSQGKKGGGGNAVNLFRVDYADSQAESLAAKEKQAKQKALDEEGEKADGNANKTTTAGNVQWLKDNAIGLACAAVAAVALAAALIIIAKRRKSNKK